MYYIKRFISYMLGLFGTKHDAVEIAANKLPIVVKKERKKRTPYYVSTDGKTTSFSESFSALLSNLKHMFEVVELPTSWSWISADERVGFTRLGIYIPHPWEMVMIGDDEDVIVKTEDGLPAMMAVAFPHEDTEDSIAPQIFFALKLSKLPLGVQPLRGHPYKFGEVVKLDGKLLWLVMYVVIDKETGKVSVCREQRQEVVNIRNKPRSERDRSHYNKRWSGNPAMMYPHEAENKDLVKVLHHYKVIFKNVFDWWTQRKDESWNVSVKQGKRRLVFSLDRMDTKRYFADRDLSIQTSTGKRKKIIHFVSEHERVVKDKKVVIKEHLRGLNKFTWNGYDCVVTAPKFSQVSTVLFDVAPEEASELPEENVKRVGMAKVVDILINREESQGKEEYEFTQHRKVG